MSYVNRSGHVPPTQTVVGGHVVPGQRSRDGRVTAQSDGNVRVVEVRPHSQIPLSQHDIVLETRVVVVQTPDRRVPPVVRQALPPPSPQRSNRASESVTVVVKTQQNVRR